jgi:hypothetical protein
MHLIVDKMFLPVNVYGYPGGRTIFYNPHVVFHYIHH